MGQKDSCCNNSGSLFQNVSTAMAMEERLANFSDGLTEGRSSVRIEEKHVEQDGWIVNSRRAERIEVCCR